MPLRWFIVCSLLVHSLFLWWPVSSVPMTGGATRACSVAVHFSSPAPKVLPAISLPEGDQKHFSEPQIVRSERVPSAITPKATQPVDVEEKTKPAHTVSENDVQKSASQSRKPVVEEPVSAQKNTLASTLSPPTTAENIAQASRPEPIFSPESVAFGGSSGPSFLHFVHPVYPMRAKRQHKEGRVVLRFVITPKGVAENILVIVSAGEGLDNAAMDSIRRSHFVPLTRNGIALPCITEVPVAFRLR